MGQGWRSAPPITGTGAAGGAGFESSQQAEQRYSSTPGLAQYLHTLARYGNKFSRILYTAGLIGSSLLLLLTLAAVASDAGQPQPQGQ